MATAKLVNEKVAHFLSFSLRNRSNIDPVEAALLVFRNLFVR